MSQSQSNALSAVEHRVSPHRADNRFVARTSSFPAESVDALLPYRLDHDLYVFLGTVNRNIV